MSEVFELNNSQCHAFEKFRKDHGCSTKPTTVGGRISIIFTPTGLGMIIKAKCVCGKSINLTDATNW